MEDKKAETVKNDERYKEMENKPFSVSTNKKCLKADRR